MKRWTRSGLYDFLEENLKIQDINKILVIGGFGQVLDLINQRVPSKNIKTLDIQLARRPDYLLDISDPKLTDVISERFDQIICMEVLEQVPNYELALSNIINCLMKMEILWPRRHGLSLFMINHLNFIDSLGLK